LLKLRLTETIGAAGGRIGTQLQASVYVNILQNPTKPKRTTIVGTAMA